MPLWSRIIAWATALVAMVASAITLTGGAARASTGYDCQTREYYLVCLDITGTGLHINSMGGWMRNNLPDTMYRLHIELLGPHGLIKNCAQFNVRAKSNSPDCVWSPNRNEPSGNYCSILWYHSLTGNGYSNIGEQCAGVHRLPFIREGSVMLP
jgi:hypothetical protein